MGTYKILLGMSLVIPSGSDARKVTGVYVLILRWNGSVLWRSGGVRKRYEKPLDR